MAASTSLIGLKAPSLVLLHPMAGVIPPPSF